MASVQLGKTDDSIIHVLMDNSILYFSLSQYVKVEG